MRTCDAIFFSFFYCAFVLLPWEYRRNHFSYFFPIPFLFTPCPVWGTSPFFLLLPLVAPIFPPRFVVLWFLIDIARCFSGFVATTDVYRFPRSAPLLFCSLSSPFRIPLISIFILLPLRALFFSVFDPPQPTPLPPAVKDSVLHSPLFSSNTVFRFPLLFLFVLLPSITLLFLSCLLHCFEFALMLL